MMMMMMMTTTAMMCKRRRQLWIYGDAGSALNQSGNPSVGGPRKQDVVGQQG